MDYIAAFDFRLTIKQHTQSIFDKTAIICGLKHFVSFAKHLGHFRAIANQSNRIAQ